MQFAPTVLDELLAILGRGTASDELLQASFRAIVHIADTYEAAPTKIALNHGQRADLGCDFGSFKQVPQGSPPTGQHLPPRRGTVARCC